MQWIFGAFLAASIVHMVEEYFYPGGFLDVMKRLNPRFAVRVTTPMAIVINGLQLLLCVVAILVGESAIVLSMSVAGLLFINALVHIGGSIRIRGYAPGVMSGLALYLPLSIYAYHTFLTSGQLNANQALLTGLLGLVYQAVPIVYLGLASRSRN